MVFFPGSDVLWWTTAGRGVLLPDGWIDQEERASRIQQLYGYGHDYKEALRDFYRLCGKTPMLQGLLSKLVEPDIINILKKATMS